MAWADIHTRRVPRRGLEAAANTLGGFIEAVERHLKVHEVEHAPRDFGEGPCLSCRILEEELKDARELRRTLGWEWS